MVHYKFPSVVIYAATWRHPHRQLLEKLSLKEDINMTDKNLVFAPACT